MFAHLYTLDTVALALDQLSSASLTGGGRMVHSWSLSSTLKFFSCTCHFLLSVEGTTTSTPLHMIIPGVCSAESNPGLNHMNDMNVLCHHHCIQVSSALERTAPKAPRRLGIHASQRLEDDCSQ
jgi:hypothetical protein